MLRAYTGHGCSSGARTPAGRYTSLSGHQASARLFAVRGGVRTDEAGIVTGDLAVHTTWDGERAEATVQYSGTSQWFAFTTSLVPCNSEQDSGWTGWLQHCGCGCWTSCAVRWWARWTRPGGGGDGRRSG
ncbi:hypothetical protein [Streptomyces chiangmaiensis]|uniref:Uncharacterized protein n=1 Tax=Streptomyces chiangmaiensis TaxID=766497 RepID=A0ABU7FVZ5_9ACTN|nr:hypothetical protein [Streptomyces chiangmaiensis]MED7828285.1 hypothetical protein [Streptomyces chiangmaiensis]